MAQDIGLEPGVVMPMARPAPVQPAPPAPAQAGDETPAEAAYREKEAPEVAGPEDLQRDPLESPVVESADRPGQELPTVNSYDRERAEVEQAPEDYQPNREIVIESPQAVSRESESVPQVEPYDRASDSFPEIVDSDERASEVVPLPEMFERGPLNLPVVDLNYPPHQESMDEPVQSQEFQMPEVQWHPVESPFRDAVQMDADPTLGGQAISLDRAGGYG